MPKLLTELEIKSRLVGLRGWKREGDFITRTFEFGSFMQGIRFINRIAKIAEQKQHHPDILVRYTTINLSIQTHDAGGLTKKDFDLASAIERLLPRRKKKIGA